MYTAASWEVLDTFSSKQKADKRAARPVEKTRRHAVMLHQEVWLPMIGRLILAGELRSSAFKFESEILFLAENLVEFVFRRVELGLQSRGPASVFLTSETP
jgi:hypothetical protein